MTHTAESPAQAAHPIGGVQAYDLSLVLACYNEEPVFAESVRQILCTLDHTTWHYEVIFVDDCSQDGTRSLIERLLESDRRHNLRKVFHSSNTGRGRAVADGIRLASGKVVGYIDIDLEVHARYIPPCVLAIEDGYDIATAHRIYKFYWRGLVRWILSQGYVKLQHALLGVDFKDTETGFKFFRRQKILSLLDEVEDAGWFWDTEVMVRAHLREYAIVEIPCLFQRRFDKKSTVRLLPDTLSYLGKIVAFRRRMPRLRSPRMVG